MKAYKGFDKDLKCRGMQYEVGKEYEMTGEVVCCNSGYHACEAPMDVWKYYPPTTSRYCEVEQSGYMSRDSDDTKVASNKIKIGAEIGIKGIIKAQIEYVRERAKNGKTGGDWSQFSGGVGSQLVGGYRSQLAGGNWSWLAGGNCSQLFGGVRSQLVGGDWSQIAGGYRSQLAGGTESQLVGGNCSQLFGGVRSQLVGGDWSQIAGGYRSQLVAGDKSQLAGGDWSQLAGGYGSELAGGKSSILVCGDRGRAKGGLNSVIVLTQWRFLSDEFIPSVRAITIDGEHYKPDTWYMLKDGEVVEVAE